MTALDQLQMFEPQGETLAGLAAKYFWKSESEHRTADNLMMCGLNNAAALHTASAQKALEQACVCETALQLERLAGLV